MSLDLWHSRLVWRNMAMHYERGRAAVCKDNNGCHGEIIKDKWGILYDVVYGRHGYPVHLSIISIESGEARRLWLRHARLVEGDLAMAKKPDA